MQLTSSPSLIMYSKQLKVNQLTPQTVNCKVTSPSQKALPAVTTRSILSSRSRTNMATGVRSERTGFTVNRCISRPGEKSPASLGANTVRAGIVTRTENEEPEDDVDSMPHSTAVEILSNTLNRRRQTTDVIVRATNRSQPSKFGMGNGPRRTVSLLPVQMAKADTFGNGLANGKLQMFDRFSVFDVIPPIQKHPTPGDDVETDRISEIQDVQEVKTSKPALHGSDAEPALGRTTFSNTGVLVPCPVGRQVTDYSVLERIAHDDDDGKITNIAGSNTAVAGSSVAESSHSSIRRKRSSYCSRYRDQSNIYHHHPSMHRSTLQDHAASHSDGSTDTSIYRRCDEGISRVDRRPDMGRFSVAEWNRQKAVHLRRASLRRSCFGVAQHTDWGYASTWMRTTTTTTIAENGSLMHRARPRNPDVRRTTSRSVLSAVEQFSAAGTIASHTPTSAALASSKVQHSARGEHNIEDFSSASQGKDYRRGQTQHSLWSHQACTSRPQGVRHVDEYCGQRQQQQLQKQAACMSSSRQHNACKQNPHHRHESICYHRSESMTPRDEEPSTEISPRHRRSKHSDDFRLESDAMASNTSESVMTDAILVELEKVTNALQLQKFRQDGAKYADSDKESSVLKQVRATCDEQLGVNVQPTNRDDNAELLPVDASALNKPNTIVNSNSDVRILGSTKGGGHHGRLTRKSSLADGERRGSTYGLFSETKNSSRRTTLTDSKSSTPALLEPLDNLTDNSRPVSSWSSVAVDEITSLPGSPFYNRQLLHRRSSSIDSGMSRPGSDFLDVPIMLVQARDRTPSTIDLTETTTTSSTADSPTTTMGSSPVCQINEDGHVTSCTDLQQQVVHRLSEVDRLPPVTPCHSPDGATPQDHESTMRHDALDPQTVQAPQVSLTTEDGDDFDVWFGRRGSIFIEEKGAGSGPLQVARQHTTRNALGQVSLAVPKPVDK